MDESVSFEGSNNPNYRGGTKETACEICGATFEYYPSEKEGLYCAECVENEAWRDPPTFEGSDNPQWEGGKVDLSCTVCGTPISRHPSNITGTVSVCSDACRGDWLSEEFTGEGHPNWDGGGIGNYGPGWNRVRRKALERDGHECVLCGTTREQLGRNPDVHHVVPVRVYEAADGHDVTEAHRLDNVVTLCPPCHRQAEFGHVEKKRLWEAAGIDDGGAAGGIDTASALTSE